MSIKCLDCYIQVSSVSLFGVTYLLTSATFQKLPLIDIWPPKQDIMTIESLGASICWGHSVLQSLALFCFVCLSIREHEQIEYLRSRLIFDLLFKVIQI